MSVEAPISTLDHDWAPLWTHREDGLYDWEQRPGVPLATNPDMDATPIIDYMTERRELFCYRPLGVVLGYNPDRLFCVRPYMTDRSLPDKLLGLADEYLRVIEESVRANINPSLFIRGHLTIQDEARNHGHFDSIPHLDHTDLGIVAVRAQPRPTQILASRRFQGLKNKDELLDDSSTNLHKDLRTEIAEETWETHDGIQLFGMNSSIHRKPPVTPSDTGIRVVTRLVYKYS